MAPSEFEVSEVLACARYGDEGDFEDMLKFVELHGAQALVDARDEHGNTALHLSGANGHEQIFTYLLSIFPKESLVVPNSALSLPLHWIALNFQLPLLHLLCPLLPLESYSALNNKGKTALQMAEEATEAFDVPEDDESANAGVRTKERIRRERVVGYLLQCMGLGVPKKDTGKDLVEDEDKEEDVSEKVERIKLGSVDEAKELLEKAKAQP